MSDRAVRPGAVAYIPPYLRSGSAAAAVGGGPRSLDELTPHTIRIKVEFTQGSPFNFELCPDNFVEESTDGQDSTDPPRQQQQQHSDGAEPAQAPQATATEGKGQAEVASAANAQSPSATDTSGLPPPAADVAAEGAARSSGNAEPAGAAAAADDTETAQAQPAEQAAGGSSAQGPDGGTAADTGRGTRKKAPLETRYLSSPACPDSYQIKQLLRWFREACRETSEDFPKGDMKAILSLPSCLSKRERAMWHAEADRLGLNSQSTGFGDGRYLQIRPSGSYHKASSWWHKPQGGSHAGGRFGQGPHRHHMMQAAEGDAEGAETQPHPEQLDSLGEHGDTEQQQQQQHPDPSNQHHQQQWEQHQQQPRQQWGGRGPGGSSSSRRPPDLAKQLWDWCQMEGGALWNYSQGEIREALAAVGGDVDKLPVELSAVVAKRRLAQRLAAALQSRDEAAAYALLEEAGSSTRLGWVRDPDSGGYPSHIAAWHGLGPFITKLVEREGAEVLQQHDASRATPTQLAQRRGHTELAAQLEQLVAARGSSSSSTPDVPAAGERGFAPAAAAAAAGAVGAAEGDVGDVAGVEGGVRDVGPGRGFGRGGFGRGRGRGLPAAAAAVGGAAAGELEPGHTSGTATGAAEAGEPAGSTAAATTNNAASSTAAEAEAQQQQQQQQQESANEGEEAPAPVAAAAQASAASGSDIYCSYATRDDRSFVLFGRTGGHRGGRGGNFRGRSGGCGGRGGGRWQGRGGHGWHGRGQGGRYGGGRGRGPHGEGEGAGSHAGDGHVQQQGPGGQAE